MAFTALTPTSTVPLAEATPFAGEEAALTGARLGHIRIGELVGRGGMGSVFAGFDEKLERRVAVKAVSSGRFDAGARARLLREARILSQLRHPHICQVHEYVDDGERDFIVLELIDGRDLHEVIAASPSRATRFRIAEQILGALVAAHGLGIVHRDLKPRNVMLTHEGEVKVLDFGIAAHTQGEGELPEGAVVGTLAYMSPEQARGESVSTASDIYSCGLLLQEVFTGRPAFAPGLSLPEQLARARDGVTQPVRGLDAGLSALVLRMKALAPAARPSAVDALDRLRDLRAAPGQRRRRLVLGAGVAAIAVMAAAMTIEAAKAERAAERASLEAEAARQVSDLLVGLFEVAGEEGGSTVTARELIDRGAARMETGLGDQPPLVRARMMHAIGAVYQELGLYDKSLRMHQQALVLREAEMGRDHVDVADSLEEMGGVHLLSGDTERAEARIRQALATRARSGTGLDVHVAALWADLGEVHQVRGDLARALPYYQRALTLQEAILGPQHPSIGETVHQLGIAYREAGDPARSEPLLLRAAGLGYRPPSPGAE